MGSTPPWHFPTARQPLSEAGNPFGSISGTGNWAPGTNEEYMRRRRTLKREKENMFIENVKNA
jgi:hypothetical protein